MTPGTRRIPAVPGGQGPRADLVSSRPGVAILVASCVASERFRCVLLPLCNSLESFPQERFALERFPLERFPLERFPLESFALESFSEKNLFPWKVLRWKVFPFQRKVFDSFFGRSNRSSGTPETP